MAKYAALVIVAAAFGGCTTYDRDTTAAGATAPATHAVDVKMDRDGSVQRYNTDFNLRDGDRVRVQPDGKVAPL